MHIHANRLNPNLDLNAAYAAQQAQAKREAEATRKKLFDSAIRLAAENEDCVVSIGSQSENSGNRAKQEHQSRKEEKKDVGHDAGNHVSDWA